MKNIYTIILLLVMVAIVSCNDLSEEVYSDLTVDGYEYSESEIYAVIGPVYSALRGWHHHRGVSACQMASTDVMCMPANASGWDDGGKYKRLHFHTWTAEDEQVNRGWDSPWKVILHTNRIIDQLASGVVPVPEEENVDALIAEMKVMRALNYWMLIDNYGDIPFVDKQTQEIPEKMSRPEIFGKIVKDIEDNMNLLSADNGALQYGRINKWGAKALLANLYLNAEVYTGTAEWDKCEKQCDDIITSGKYELQYHYKDNFDHDNEDSKENIFVIVYDELFGSGLFINHIFHAASKAKYDMANTPWGAGSLKAVSQFIDTYDEDDTRLDDTWEHGPQFASDGVTPLLCTYEKAGQQLNYSKDLPDGIYTGEDEGYRVKKFLPAMGSEKNLDNDFPIFRYAQVLMMKAECLLRMGKAGEAATIVTQVRERAFRDTNPAKATVTADDLTADTDYQYGYVENYEIVEPGDQSPVEFGGFYDELGYEFVGEWTRRRDMIRFGTYTTKSWLSHKPNGNYRAVFPIPQKAVDTNPKLDQNPSYQ